MQEKQILFILEYVGIRYRWRISVDNYIYFFEVSKGWVGYITKIPRAIDTSYDSLQGEP